MADAKLLRKEATLKKLRRIPEAVQEAAAGPLEAAAESLVQAFKRACPIDAGVKDGHKPGELRDSIEKYKNEDRPLSWRIIVGAKDKKGWFWGRNVEFGHGDAAPRPWFWPTYRAQKKPIRTKMYAVVRKALKALFAS